MEAELYWENGHWYFEAGVIKHRITHGEAMDHIKKGGARVKLNIEAPGVAEEAPGEEA